MNLRPVLVESRRAGIRLLTDPGARRAGILIAFTDRMGGVSSGPYAHLNLGRRVGDADDNVRSNSAAVARALGVDTGSFTFVFQKHGAEVVEARPGDSGVIGDADVLVARRPGPVPGVVTADCAPLVIAGDAAVAVVHAGWRGLVAGAIDNAVAAVGEARSAWVGPAIRACCYEVGPEVVAAFDRAGLPVAARDRVDVGEAAVHALRRAGVAQLAAAPICTSCDPRYFSYRRDGITGRQAGFGGLTDGAPAR